MAPYEALRGARYVYFLEAIDSFKGGGRFSAKVIITSVSSLEAVCMDYITVGAYQIFCLDPPGLPPISLSLSLKP